MSAQSEIGGRIVAHAECVQDMSSRVVAVLERDPRDHHYAASKLIHALAHAAEALTLAGFTGEELAELVSDAHEKGAEHRRELEREFANEAEEARR